MNSKTTEARDRHLLRRLLIIIGLAVLAISTGCARKPWREPLAAPQRDDVLQVLAELRKGEADRGTCIDSDVNIFFTSTVKNRAVSGYMQLAQPASVKFITANPLGQPLVAFVSDGRKVQFVNTFEKYYTDGDLAVFARLFDLPPAAYASDWGKWLTGRLPAADRITDIRQDESQHGVWVSFAAPTGKEEHPVTEHLLLDPEKRQMLGRVFTDVSGSIAARISYSDWLPADADNRSRQPGKITISELDYGGRLELRFSSLQPMDPCTSKNFTLPRPPGYRYEPLPEDGK